jgi:hypothetical protein
MTIRDQILSADDLTSEKTEVPEWGVTIVVREMTGAQRDYLEQTMVTHQGTKSKVKTKNWRGELLRMSCYDLDGEVIFTAKDVEALMLKSASVLDRLCDIAMRLSGFDLKAAEELGKD